MTPRVCAICKRPNPPRRPSYPCPSPDTCSRGPEPHTHAGKQPDAYRTYLVRATTGQPAWECATCARLGTPPKRKGTITTTEHLPLGRLRDGTMDEQVIVRERERAKGWAAKGLDAVVARLYDPRRAFSLDPAHSDQPNCERGPLGDLCQRYHADPYAHNAHVAMLLASALTPVTDVLPAPDVPPKRKPVGERNPLARGRLAAGSPEGGLPPLTVAQANYVAAPEDQQNYRVRGGRKWWAARDLSELEREAEEAAELDAIVAQDTLQDLARVIGALGSPKENPA